MTAATARGFRRVIQATATPAQNDEAAPSTRRAIIMPGVNVMYMDPSSFASIPFFG
jgi:hypothetical protein